MRAKNTYAETRRRISICFLFCFFFSIFSSFINPLVNFCLQINSILLIILLRGILRATKTKNNKTPAKHVKDWLRRFAMLLPILGITWSFGFLTFITSTAVFHYIFTILNSFQGVFIFVSFCILDDSVSPYFFIISFDRPRIAPHDFPCTPIVFILYRLLKLREKAERKKT